MGNFEELLVNKGLYDKIEITINDLDEMQKYLSKNEYDLNKIECFCVWCGEKRVFEYVNSEVHESTSIRMNVFDKSRVPNKAEKFASYLHKRYSLTYSCTRHSNHRIFFDLLITDNEIIKIGQFPSVADFVIPEIIKYKSVLGEQYREYSKALGLFAHGVGIGSFVYLRRIIEKIVFDKYDEVADELKITRDEFMCKKFDDKIDVLKEYLPKVLVENRNVYGIVSKGIHELSEKECLEMFPYIKLGIEMILDDILVERERREKEKAFKNFVAEKTGELKR